MSFRFIVLLLWIGTLSVHAQSLEEWKERFEREDLSLLSSLYDAGPEIVPLAQKGLCSKNEMLRSASVYLLGKFKSEESIEAIVSLSHDPSWKVRCAAVTALGKFQDSSLCKPVTVFLQDRDWQVRYNAIRQLSRLYCKDFIGILHRLLQDKGEREEVLSSACETLGEIGDRSSIPLLFEMLASPHSRVRLQGERALERMAMLHINYFLDRLKDKKEDVENRYFIVSILGRIDAKNTISIVHSLARDPDENERIRYIAQILLADWEGARHSALFMDCFHEKSDVVRKGAILALGKIKEKKVIPELFSLLKKTGGPLNESVLWAITQFDPEQTTPMILRFLSDPDPRVVHDAIRMVGTLEIEEAITPLLAIKDDSLSNAVCWAFEILLPRIPPDHPDRPRIQKILEEGEIKRKENARK